MDRVAARRHLTLGAEVAHFAAAEAHLLYLQLPTSLFPICGSERNRQTRVTHIGRAVNQRQPRQTTPPAITT